MTPGKVQIEELKVYHCLLSCGDVAGLYAGYIGIYGHTGQTIERTSYDFPTSHIIPRIHLLQIKDRNDRNGYLVVPSRPRNSGTKSS